MSEWQPIETAPKDRKTRILCYGRPSGLSKAKQAAICIWVDGKWEIIHDTDGMAYGNLRATHWQPLPEPPQ